MWKTKTEAFRLRRLKKSYSEISKELGIPKTTLSDWFRDESWSRMIRDDLSKKESLSSPKKRARVILANKKRWAAWHSKCRDEAVAEFPKHRDNPLFLAGLMLYWGEGDKQIKNCRVRLGNVEPEMIRLFYRFLQEVVSVPQEKITAWLLLYPDLVDSVQKNFWSKATGIPVGQFRKSIYIKGRHPTKRLSYGVCTVTVDSRALKEKMLKWLELYQNYFRGLTIEKFNI